MTTFKRARNEEQREFRRQAILDTAGAMLTEMTVAQISLNELARRVGLAKSNLLRYFESREAVLLELLDQAFSEWLDALDALDQSFAQTLDQSEGVERVAAAVARSLADRPVLCDLLSAQAAVLERNVSPEVAATYKRAAVGGAMRLGTIVRQVIPALDEQSALQFAGVTVMASGAIWSHTQPSAAMLVAYAADPELARMRLDFATTLQTLLATQLTGLLAVDDQHRLRSERR